MATDDGGYDMFITSLHFSLSDVPVPVGVDCPPVVAPGIPFSCSFSAIGGYDALDQGGGQFYLEYSIWEMDDAGTPGLNLTSPPVSLIDCEYLPQKAA